jgi:hypothetical protein
VNDILVSVELESPDRAVGYWSGNIVRDARNSEADSWGTDTQAGMCLYYSGGFLNFTPESEGWRHTYVHELRNSKAYTFFSGYIALLDIPSSQKFNTNYNTFKRIVESNYDNLSRSFLRKLP